MHITIFLKKHKDELSRFLELALIALLFFGAGILYVEHFVAQRPGIVVIDQEPDETLHAQATAGDYVASKNGKNYYLTTCPNRIKEENKVYFKTAEDAQKAGFTPSARCFK